MAIPDGIQTATVVWQAQTAQIDAEDVDRDPDFVPLVGANVTISCAAQRVIIATAPPTTVVMNPISGVTNEEGVLIGPDGLPGLKIVATDNPDINPINFTYNVQITGAGPTIKFAIAAPGGLTIDLSSVIPITSSSGIALTPITVGLPAVGPNGELLTAVDGLWESQPMASGLPDASLLADGATLTTQDGVWIVVEPTPPPEDPYGDLILSHEPFRYWKFSEESGDMVDYTDNTDTMPIQGYGSETDQDPIAPFTSRSVHMDASWFYTDTISVDDTDMTFECWFNRDVGGSADGFHQLFGVDSAIAGTYLFLDISRSTDPDTFRMYGNGSAATDGSIPPDDAPHHMVVTVSRSTGQLKLYIDTALVMTTFGYPSYTYNDTPIMIGNGNNPSSAVHAFKGLMSDFAIYQRALTLTEIGQHYEMGTEGP